MATKRPGFGRLGADQAAVEISPIDTQDEKHADLKNPKGTFDSIDEVEAPPAFNAEAEDHFGEVKVVENAKDLVTHVLHVDDDPTLNPWTFRAFFLGIGLALFGSVLQEIYYFKPQVIYVSVVFVTVIAYCLGMALALIPRIGPIGRFLNPQPFNSKEHAFIVIMASAATAAPVATEILAAQRLYYNMQINAGAAIFLVISTQLVGYGLAGLLRSVLVRPTKLLWPINLPVNTLLETLHRDKKETSQRLKLFYIIFAVIFVWEIIPEWIFPLLQGVSIFCLAHQNSLTFTNLFGGSQGNEGLGFLSVSFDWQYIAGLGSPLWVPLQTLFNSLVGYLLCIVLFMSIYYGNIWRSQDFPFLSQLLYNTTSTSTAFVTYDITTIIDASSEINSTAFAEQGIPYLTGSYVGYLITTNMGITATIVHMLLFNFQDIKNGFAFLQPQYLKRLLVPSNWLFWRGAIDKERYRAETLEDPDIDPHYKLMIKNGYDECPNWWYGTILAISLAVGLGTLYAIESTLPWWGFIVANIFAFLFILFFGVQYGITGFQFNQQPIAQMLAGYMHPLKPIANMWFTTFCFNGVQQGQWLARDLKLAQFAHLSPKSTFTAQVLGSVIGSIFNYIMMQTIVTNQYAILTSIEGSNIWSGQNVQQYNTLALAWSVAGQMFSIGARYQWVTISYLVGFIVPVPFYLAWRFTKIECFRYFYTGIVLWYMGWLFVGVNSSIFTYFLLGVVAQWWLRKYHPNLFVKYNYLVSAALDGGTQVIVFILSFAVFGGSGVQHEFPLWAGNNGGFSNKLNVDYCAYNSANG